MIYLDSCALVKLVHEEDESEALQRWIDERAAVPVVTSELARAEVCRVIRRANHSDQGVVIDPDGLAEDLAEADQLLSGLDQVALDRDLLVRVGALENPMIRTLDAIHLVSALELRPAELDFVTYDRQLAAAAHDVGLHVVAPH